MSITTKWEWKGMQEVSQAVAETLKEMRAYAQPGTSAYELDQYGGQLLAERGARSAPRLTYGFPGYTCVSVNHEIAHGLPSKNKVLKEGDLVNIDVSAEMKGFWADNGGSFVLGRDLNGHQPLVDASKEILHAALHRIKGGMRIALLGKFIEDSARQRGYKVIKNLVGHGVGRSLHEDTKEVPCFYDRLNVKHFRKNSVIALETFISTRTTQAYDAGDGWTLTSKDGSFVAQHEHTLVVTDDEPVILTAANGLEDAWR